jgi:chromosome segregation ATPase
MSQGSIIPSFLTQQSHFPSAPESITPPQPKGTPLARHPAERTHIAVLLKTFSPRRNAAPHEREETAMDETAFQAKLAELMGEISTLPASERDKLESLAKETQERHQQLRASINSLQESLDWLRLSVKYLVFDLEATRRENAYLRQMLESNSEEGNAQ